MSLLTDFIGVTLQVAWNIIRATWWFVTPVVLLYLIKDYWLIWRQIKYASGLSFILLEIRLPPEVEKTPKAMEGVLAGIHGAWDELTFREKWLGGEAIPSFSLEIAGIDGEMHFYIYTRTKLRNLVESSIYSQYPDAEINEVEDYAQNVPPDLPNRQWDMWGADMKFNQPDPYPIRTYYEFEDPEEERRIDPLSQAAEMFAKLQPGEQIWIQIIIKPVMGFEWKDKGKEILTKLKGQKPEVKVSPLGKAAEALADLITMTFGGKPVKQAKKEEPFTTMRLTPGEQDVLKGVERKLSKVGFLTTMRTIYLARRDVMNKAHIAGMQGFFRQFATENLNSFRPDASTIPKSSLIWLKKTRQYIRKRRVFQTYKMRMLGFLSKPMVLNTEELATLYHFPGTVVKAPMMPRLQATRREPPGGLPIE